VNPGLVFNLQRYAVQDGPGLRSTVFLKGCPLTCLWCHNPESQGVDPEIVRLETRCLDCGRCGGRALDAAAVAGCPTGALQEVGRAWEPAELVRALLRDRIFFDQSGGGVTFSGGEPLLQVDFLVACLERLRAEGVHTALDTCGFASWEALRRAASLSSLVLYDLKLMDDARHRAATGQSNRLILENLERLSGLPVPIRVRVPVIPGLNDDPENLEATAAFLAGLGSIRQVDLLPYHGTGVAKAARVGRPSLAGLAPPAPERLEALAAVFRGRGCRTCIGGQG